MAYEIDGERHDEMPMTQTEFHHAKPVYECFAGLERGHLRRAARSTTCRPTPRPTCGALEELSGAPFWGVGVGPGREESIVLTDAAV